MFLEIGRGSAAGGAVPPAAVGEGFDGIEDHQACGGSGGRVDAGEAFGLEGGGEAFGQRVVAGVALAAHARGDVPGAQASLEGIGGVLAAAVAVVDEPRRRPLTLHGALEGRGGQRGGQVFAAVVGDAAARAGIEGEGGVEPAFSGAGTASASGVARAE